MHEIELAGRDLNLLVVLRELLETRSVSLAARRLALSPPATSHALGRLRESFDDPLLVRAGNLMVATPRAEALRPALDRVLEEARLLYRGAPAFVPEASNRRFTIGASDLLAPVSPDLVATLERESPNVTLALVPEVPATELGALASGEIDLGLRAQPEPRLGLVIEPLGHIDFVVVARSDHPYAREPDLARWRSAPHVVVSTGRPGASHVGTAIVEAGVTRRIGLSVPTFLLALHSVVDTNLIFTAPGSLASPIAKRLGLAVLPPPLAIPIVPIAAVWHERFSSDPGHRWFRDRVSAILTQRLLQSSDDETTKAPELAPLP